MKSQLKRYPALRFTAASVIRMLAVVALTVSAVFLAPAPVHAQTSPVALQCQVSTSGTALSCTGTIPDGSGMLQCQSPDVISDDNGVITASQITCTGTIVLAGITVPGTLTAAALTIDTNHDTITATPGAGTLTVDQGLSTLTASCQGGTLSANLSSPALNIPDGVCGFTLSVLDVGTAQLAVQNGSIGLVNGSTLSINSPSISLTTSLLGIPVTTIACGSSIPLSLGQLPSISDLLTLCKGS